MQDGPPLRAAEVERQPALGAVVDDPPIVVRTVGNAGSARAMAIGVAVGRLELDDVGAEIREDGRGDWPRAEAGAGADTQTVEQELRRGTTIDSAATTQRQAGGIVPRSPKASPGFMTSVSDSQRSASTRGWPGIRWARATALVTWSSTTTTAARTRTSVIARGSRPARNA